MFNDIWSVFKKGSFTFKFCFIVPLIMPLFYLIAIFDMPYGYYVFLQIISLIFVGTFAWAYSKNINCFLNYPSFSSWAIVVLFNPFLPFEFEKGWWIFFDIVAILLLLGSFVVMLGHFDAVMSLSPSQLSEFLGTKDKEEYIKRFTPQDDQFVKDASDFLQQWEREKEGVVYFNGKLYETISIIQHIILKTVCDKFNGEIKKNPIAVMDFSYYVFFYLFYLPLCKSTSEEYCKIFYQTLETVITDTFSPFITDSDFFKKFFDDRSQQYDSIMSGSCKKFSSPISKGMSNYDFLVHRVCIFISADLYTNDCFSFGTSVSIDLVQKQMHISDEISDLFKKVSYLMDPYANEIEGLYNVYRRLKRKSLI